MLGGHVNGHGKALQALAHLGQHGLALWREFERACQSHKQLLIEKFFQ
ncbi:hypothetical protein GALL_340130 [mine drainage metagenome]|uniref:Uncharacterized protein n=1 Tax=mine drainage metagenome TaxID=410659 RepID=A0A1J5QWF5_9ZZZZ